MPIDGDDYEAAWDISLSVLLKAHIRTIRAALPHLRRAKHPRIVNIASTEGLGATRFQSPYTAAKTGVIGLTRSLAVELGPEGITVNWHLPRTHPHGHDGVDSRGTQARVRAPARRAQAVRRPGGSGARHPWARAAGIRLHHGRNAARRRRIDDTERLARILQQGPR